MLMVMALFNLYSSDFEYKQFHSKHDIIMVIAFSINDQKQFCLFKFWFCLKPIKLCMGFAY